MPNLRVCKRRYGGARSNPAKVFLPPGQAKQPTLLSCAIKKKLMLYVGDCIGGTEKKEMVPNGRGIHFVTNGHINCQNYNKILFMFDSCEAS